MASNSGCRLSPGFPRSVVATTLARVGVQHGKLDLILGGVEVDEQVVDLVQHFLRARVGPVDLVQHDDRRQPALERLAQHESRLRQRPLRGVDEQHHAVHHRQRPLDFPAEIRVTRGIDDVDQEVFVVDRGVLREDGDAALALEVGVVHHPIGHLLIGTKGAALPQQRVDEGRLAMVDVRDDGDVAPQRVGDLCGLSVTRHLPSIAGRYEPDACRCEFDSCRCDLVTRLCEIRRSSMRSQCAPSDVEGRRAEPEAEWQEMLATD